MNHFEAPPLDMRPERTRCVVCVGGLRWWTTERELVDLCARFGTVVNAKIALEKSNGKSKGWAFVEFGSPDEATQCLKQMHDVALRYALSDASIRQQ